MPHVCLLLADGHTSFAGQALFCTTFAENTESFFSTFFDEHFSQETFSLEFFTIFSKSLPHFEQWYSYIGIVASPKIFICAQ